MKPPQVCRKHHGVESEPSALTLSDVDRPFADLYNTEGDGGFPGPNFFARPVVGGHFAFLTLEKACDGKAMDGLKFLEEESSVEHLLKVETAATDMRERAAAKRG